MLPIKKLSSLSSIFAGSGATTAVLAKLACPFCYPAAAGLVSSLGLGFVINETYLNILTVFLISVALFGLWFGKNQHGGYAPFLLGLGAVGIGGTGRFLGTDIFYFAGIGGIVGASVWNIVRKRRCSSCASGATHVKTEAQRSSEMAAKRKIEVFTAGCPACDETVKLVKANSCPSCDVSVLNVNDPATKNRVAALGIRSIPAVVIDGKLADCCVGKGPTLEALKAAGLGRA